MYTRRHVHIHTRVYTSIQTCPIFIFVSLNSQIYKHTSTCMQIATEDFDLHQTATRCNTLQYTIQHIHMHIPLCACKSWHRILISTRHVPPLTLGDLKPTCRGDMTHSQVRYASSWVLRDSFIFGTWLIHWKDMTHSQEGHDSFTGAICKFVCVSRLIHVWDMTRSQEGYHSL